MSARLILLTPGPVTLSPRVREASARADLGHREPEFAALTRGILDGLERVYDGADEYAAVLLTGSGTAAVEVMLSTFAPREKRTLVAINGVYGERMATILRLQGKPFVSVGSDWLCPLALDAIERALRDDESITHVAAVHHETTTGRLNDIDGLGQLCARLGRKLLLDTVSSFGAERIEFEPWSLQALAGSANKCLHGVPGLAFVLASKEALRADGHATTLYLDARMYYRVQSVDGFSPFTQAVQTALALREALRELADAGGWQSRGQCYAERAARVSAALERAGVEPLLPAEATSRVLRSYYLPKGLSYKALHDQLEEAGFIIYDGQGRLQGELFRIAHMGQIDAGDLDRLCSVLSAVCAPRAGLARGDAGRPTPAPMTSNDVG